VIYPISAGATAPREILFQMAKAKGAVKPKTGELTPYGGTLSLEFGLDPFSARCKRMEVITGGKMEARHIMQQGYVPVGAERAFPSPYPNQGQKDQNKTKRKSLKYKHVRECVDSRLIFIRSHGYAVSHG
jgi:hypothetical protein